MHRTRSRCPIPWRGRSRATQKPRAENDPRSRRRQQRQSLRQNRLNRRLNQRRRLDRIEHKWRSPRPNQATVQLFKLVFFLRTEWTFDENAKREKSKRGQLKGKFIYFVFVFHDYLSISIEGRFYLNQISNRSSRAPESSDSRSECHMSSRLYIYVEFISSSFQELHPRSRTDQGAGYRVHEQWRRHSRLPCFHRRSC